MRIIYLKLTNFKGLKNIEFSNIPNIVILAGPNGIGKSSILEAILFLKEFIAPYPPYTNNISPFVSPRLNKIISSGEEYAEIQIKFQLESSEIRYLKNLFGPNRHHEILTEYDITCRVSKGGGSSHNCPEVLKSLFQIPNRQDVPDIGLIDLVDAHRTFSNIELTGINIDSNTLNDIARRIMPGGQKFNNFKQLIIKLRIQELIDNDNRKNDADSQFERKVSKLDYIRKLFDLIPPKELLDIELDNSPIKIMIKTPLGNIDIDELSSGEKEILFVFSDLFSIQPNNSILLLDEPDLHLNEKIQHKIIDLLKQLGSNNQIWISTHSTAIINNIDINCLFKISPNIKNNQISKVIDDDDKIVLIQDIVGSRSILTMGERIVFIEGVERNDKYILEKWFDKISTQIIFVNSDSVNDINKINGANLALLDSSTKYSTYFFCIRDRDFLDECEINLSINKNKGKIYIWNKYHIENYLINGQAIFNIFENFYNNPFKNSNDCMDKIKETVVLNREIFVNKLIDYDIKRKFKVTRNLVIKDNYDEIKMNDEIKCFKKYLLDLSEISINVKEIISHYNNYFDDLIKSERWVDILPGRTILKIFLNKYGKDQLRWEYFRNQLIKEIKILGIPEEVDLTIKKIESYKHHQIQ